MRLLITTPAAVIVDQDDVVAMRAEDDTGAFGVLPRHADFLTVLAPSVLTWRLSSGQERYAAVRGGVLTIRGGDTAELATREAIASDDLQALQHALIDRLRGEAEEEARERARVTRLHLAAIRQICLYLRGSQTRTLPSVMADRAGDGSP